MTTTVPSADMSPRRNLGDHAAIGLVCCVLADDRLREDASITRHKRDGTIVARRFEAQDHGHFASGPLPEGGAMH